MTLVPVNPLRLLCFQKEQKLVNQSFFSRMVVSVGHLSLLKQEFGGIHSEDATSLTTFARRSTPIEEELTITKTTRLRCSREYA